MSKLTHRYVRPKIKQTDFRQRGQGLVEYALILILVAMVVIVVVGLIGLGLNRNYGLVSAVVGGKREVSGKITFSYVPQCGHVPGSGTGLYAEIMTTVPLSDLSVSTDKGFIMTLTPIAGGYKIQPTLTQVGQDIEDLSLCPHGLVVQASQKYGGTTVFYPVKIENW